MNRSFSEKEVSLSYLGDNSGLYAFLAANYDISILAEKIYASNYSKLNILSLRKSGSLPV